MSQILLFVVLGLGLGAMYAALGAGLVVTFKGTGVVNFAIGAMASVGAHVYDELNRTERFLLPWIVTIETGDLPTVVDLAIAAAVAAVLGLLVHLVVYGPLRSAPPLAKVVASVGVMITVQAVLSLEYGTQGRPRSPLLPAGNTEAFGAILPNERLAYVALVVAGGAALAAWFRLSRTGLAVRAAAENERSAALARLSPDRLAMLTWVVATVLTTVALIVAGTVAPVLGPFTWTLLVVPALAAALLGRLTSIGGTVLAGLGLGVFQSLLQYLSNTRSWWPDIAKVGLNDAVPFFVIVLTLFVFGKAIPLRGSVVERALPPVFLPKNRPLTVAVWAAIAVAAVVLTEGSYRFGLITSLAFMLITLSLVVLTGMVGQISLAQAAFAGTAGFALARFGIDLPFPLGILVAASVAAVVGVVVGLPAMRIRGTQLAVVSLAAAVMVERFVFGNPAILDPVAETIPDPSFLGIDLGIREGRDLARLEFGLMAVAIVVVAYVLTGNLMRARTGRRFLAVRSNERAASSIGIASSSTKLLAFAVAAFLAGLGGTLIGYSRGQLSPASFGVLVGLTALALTYLGGITSLAGAVVGGVLAPLGLLFVYVDRVFDLGQGRTAFYTLFSGVSLVLTTILNPIGIAGKTRADLDKLRARRRGAKAGGGDELVVEPAPPAVPRSAGAVVLRAEDVTVSFGGLKAVDGLTLDVAEREIVGLIGPNGAGKTTFIDALTGFVPSTGSVSLSGRSLGGLSPHARARAGLIRTWQSIELFGDLSTRANVQVAAQRTTPGGTLLDAFAPNRLGADDRIDDALALVGLSGLADRRPGELTLGHQKLLGVARALAMQPEALLLDEPAAGLNVEESEVFGDYLRNIAARGTACLLVDHDMALVLEVCDRVYVVEFGGLVAQGTPEEVRRDPAVIAAYLGSSGDAVDDDVVGSPDALAHAIEPT